MDEILNTNTENVSTDTDYIAAINELKANTVSKSDYDKVRSENKKLLDSLVNGNPYEVQIPTTNIDYNKECHELVFGEERKTNLDYVKKALEIREAALKEGINYNMPFGPKAEYGENDVEQTEYIAEKLQELVDRSENNPEAFNFLLSQVLVDNLPVKNNGRRTR